MGLFALGVPVLASVMLGRAGGESAAAVQRQNLIGS
jgi:hypothetical protein